MSEDDDQRDMQHRYAVFERSEDRVVDHMPGCAHHEGVAEAEVENDLRGQTGVRAPEDDREGVLGVHQRAAPGGVLIRV